MNVTDTGRRFAVAIAPHTNSAYWSAQGPLTWEEFIDWLDLSRPAAERDCGGYFLGELRGKRKRADTVVSRSAINLDADKAGLSFIVDSRLALAGIASVFYTTWSHQIDAPRYRLLLPLDRDVSPQEFILISRALMAELGAENFDPSCSQPSRMMLRPSTQSPGDYHWEVVDGEALSADEWIVRAHELGVDRVDKSIDDHGMGQADYDASVPPSDEQKQLAQVLLEKAEREVRTGFNESTGEPFGGRNNSCIARLPMLYRFVLGGVLGEEEVDTRIFAAVLDADGDGSFDEREYAAVSASAWDYANLSGGRRPEAESADSVFDPVDGPELPPVLWPAYRPDLYFNRGQLQVQTIADALRDVRPIAVDKEDRLLRVYDGGVWGPGEKWVSQAVLRMLRNEWTVTHRNSVKEFLRDSDQTPQLDGGAPDPRYINNLSGMLDWRTGAVVEHRPEFWSTVQIPHEWDESAECPAFEFFLDRVLPEDCQDFIWELIGYMLYSGNPLQVAPMLYGPGSNGKGTFLGVVEELLGLGNVSAVALHDLSENRFRTAELYGKLANIAGDLEGTWLPNTGIIKQITGDDTISAERKFGAAFSFKPWAVSLWSTNQVFSVSDSSEGWARRMMVVPFPRLYRGEGRDALRTASELAGVLRYGVAGLRRLMARGSFDMPESVAAETKRFLSSGDTVRAWIDDVCQVEQGLWTARTELYESYSQWATFTGAKLMSSRALYERLRQIAGLREGKREGVSGVHGIGVRAAG